jgi:hypothetical protein
MTEEHSAYFDTETDMEGNVRTELDMGSVTLRADDGDMLSFTHEEFSDIARKVLDWQVKYER